MLPQIVHLSVTMEVDRRESENTPDRLEAEWQEMQIAATSRSHPARVVNTLALQDRIQAILQTCNQFARRMGKSKKRLEMVGGPEREESCC